MISLSPATPAWLCNVSMVVPRRSRVKLLLQSYHTYNLTVEDAGSLLDKTLRLDMENPLFRKLQDAIERPCRTKEWFPMAEQAINTIYALGERPDLLCGKLIKNLTRRVFGRKPANSSGSQQDQNAMDQDEEDVDADASQQPQTQKDEDKDASDAFELSQLLFIVGHVAIKQIVFLELVEREWKRQKHEKEIDRKSTRLNSSHSGESRMPSSA